LEDASGVELDDFFDDQVFQPGFSVFVVDSFASVPEGNNFLVSVSVQQKLRECAQFYQHVPLDVTFISSNNEREEFQIDANGQFTTVQIPCSFQPAMVVLNGHNRLNQARMDHEFMVYTDQTLYPVLPFVDFRFSRENVVDSTLVRVEHVWASPDQQPLGNGVFEISTTHYFLVDGLWDESDLYSGRVNYNGSQETDLDYSLYSNGEQQAILIYRANSSDAWEIYADFTMGSGSLTNGDGHFVIDVLRRGQYAFANGDVFAGLKPVDLDLALSMTCFPNPTMNELRVAGNYSGNEVALFDVYASNGRFLQRSSARISDTFSKSIDTSALSNGDYIMQIVLANGEVLGQERFVVSR
jgi:hypothetical protein